MKKTLLTLIVFFTMLPGMAWAADLDGCQFNDIPLYGRVKIVTAFADFDVKVVNFLPDLEVKQVSSLPTACGEWQFVESFPDFTVKIVNSFPDFEIKFVDFLPGIP